MPLRTACSGGAPIPVAVIDKFTEVFAADIYEGYGLSETAGSDVQPAGLRAQARHGRPGHLGRRRRDRARRRRGRTELLPVGELGEVIIRGHNIMTGYLNNPEATAEAIVDGWFRSGDLGNGRRGRLRHDRRPQERHGAAGGFNVGPREVEEILARHPAVAQVAVIGLPDPTYGEEVRRDQAGRRRL